VVRAPLAGGLAPPLGAPEPWSGARALLPSAQAHEGSQSILFDDFPWGMVTVDVARETFPKGNGRGEWFPRRELAKPL